MTKRMLVFVLLALIGGCGGDAGRDAGAETVVRDSAGIAIAENPLPPDTGGALAIAEEPELTIGVLEGAEEYQLDGAADVARLADGRVVVVNAGSNELRYYDADGAFLRAVGGEGQGPGEFMGIAELWRLPGDSLLVFDWDTRRVTLIDERGDFVRTGNLQRGADDGGYPLGILDSQRMLVREGFMRRMRSGREGVQRDTIGFHVLEWRVDSAHARAPVLRMPGGDWFLATASNGSVNYMPVALGSLPHTDAHEGLIYHGLAERYEIRVYEADGRLQRIIRRAHEPIRVTQQVRDRIIETWLDRIEDERFRRTQAELYAKMPAPEFLPAHGRFMVDAVDRLWVQRYDPDVGMLGGNTVGATWDVSDATGGWIAAVVAPVNFGIRDIGEDYVLGVHWDELGVEQVRLYRLTR